MGSERISTPEVGQCSGILIGPQRRDTETLARLSGFTYERAENGVVPYRMLPRRRFLLSSLALAAFESLPAKLLRAAAPVFKALPAWKLGVLEIHQIATNRGNSALLILPDGTAMMVDAGAIYGTTPYLSDPLPSGQRRPGEWIGRYAKRRIEASGLTAIDTFLATHLHGDHVGYLPPDGPLSSDGTYRLTGVSDVAAIVPIQRFVDRAWPDYTYPVPADIDFQKNYRAFLEAQIKTGKRVERFRPGSKDQFVLQHKSADYPSFEIRNLIANGEVWTGKGEQTRKLFPEVSTPKPADYPAENPCSCAIRLRYGKFGYYTGGDLTNDTNYGRDPWRDSESPAAEVCGPVSVAVANQPSWVLQCQWRPVYSRTAAAGLGPLQRGLPIRNRPSVFNIATTAPSIFEFSRKVSIMNAFPRLGRDIDGLPTVQLQKSGDLCPLRKVRHSASAQ